MVVRRHVLWIGLCGWSLVFSGTGTHAFGHGYGIGWAYRSSLSLLTTENRQDVVTDTLDKDDETKDNSYNNNNSREDVSSSSLVFRDVVFRPDQDGIHSSSSSSSTSTSTQGSQQGQRRRKPPQKQSYRQRIVTTGAYPLYLSVSDCPSRAWLGVPSAKLFVNGTSATDSTVSWRGAWIQDAFPRTKEPTTTEDETTTTLATTTPVVSMELVAEIHTRKPAYVHLLPVQMQSNSNPHNIVENDNESMNDRDRRDGIMRRLLSMASLKNLQLDDEDDIKEYKKEVNEDKHGQQHERTGPDSLWVTDFSLSQKTGGVSCIDTVTGDIATLSPHPKRTRMEAKPNSRSRNRNDKTYSKDLIHDHSSPKKRRHEFTWPNEVRAVPSMIVPPAKAHGRSSSTIPIRTSPDSILVSDGFLVPGREDGGIYVVRHPGSPSNESRCRLTSTSNNDDDHRWFYHRAVWMDLTGDGRRSILAARARARITPWENLPPQKNAHAFDEAPHLNNNYNTNSNNEGALGVGQLVWLECPQPPRYDKETGLPLEDDGVTPFDPFAKAHLPWKLR